MRHFTKREQIVILIFVIIIVLIVGYSFYNRKDIQLVQADETQLHKNEEEISEQTLVETRNDDSDNKTIMIHISGQVNNPGLVELFEGDRVIDAVNNAGGFTSEADMDRINLARKVSDEEKIYVPKIGEKVEQDIQNIVTVNDSRTETDITGKININTASKDELVKLPGIGEVLADRIIEFRNKNTFQNIEDITKVSGIGNKKYDAIKDLITVR